MRSAISRGIPMKAEDIQIIGKDNLLGSHRQRARARVSEREIYENVFIMVRNKISDLFSAGKQG